MVGFGDLWLPILLSAVGVFVVSSIIHMGPFWHRTDFPRMEREDEFREAVRPLNIPPGEYMVPRAADMAETKTPEWTEKIRQGPNALVTILPPEAFNMGRSLLLWFVYTLAVSVAAAYVAGRALGPGADYLDVFRFAGTAAFLAYVGALWQAWIWFNRSLSSTLKSSLDGVIYALVTAGVFGWLWPG